MIMRNTAHYFEMSLLKICRNSLSLIEKTGTRHTSAFKYYQILREPQPDDITTTAGGIPVIVPPKPKLTGVVETRDEAEWKFVENILPHPLVPEPPKHKSYPTPSGWFPPKEPVNGEQYRVSRTRFHNFPLYLTVLNGGNRPFTVIQHVQGDIRALDADVRKYLTEKTGKKTYTSINEVCCKLWVRGTHLEDLTKFLTEKGF